MGDETITKDDRKDDEKVFKKMEKVCRTAEGKDKTMCYYMGIQTDKGQGSAGGTKKEIAGMFMRGIEAPRICKRTKKKDMQMCELRYPRKVDLSKIDFAKMRVKDLRKLMDEQG